MSTEETLLHLFLTCPFSLQCWQTIGIHWDSTLSVTEMVLQARQLFGLPSFREIVLIASWCIWTHRNSIIFDGAFVSLERRKSSFKDEIGLVLHRAKPSL
ncbi:hypothetical protein HU200_037536 [Digitaria exilis]|uniref:Reverse transcriptase zinc-binding domain-containing protein n=1 Tax=Digitaria exilis TaxID=1010633 RepID=A0A835BBJ6_9POAL|nr:hypothetical protein HU200_037536 [Digitaria exilis]